MNIRDNDLSTDIHFVTFDLETTGLHPVSCPLIATFSGHSMHLGPYRPSLSSTTEVTRTEDLVNPLHEGPHFKRRRPFRFLRRPWRPR